MILMTLGPVSIRTHAISSEPLAQTQVKIRLKLGITLLVASPHQGKWNRG